MKLSICIATYKRDKWIAETLQSILPQLNSETELVILDGGSPDNTETEVMTAVDGHPQVRYIREDKNSGVDQDFDKAVGHALGKHVWLFADDDLIRRGAITRVLEEIDRSDPDVVVIDSEVRDRDLRRTLETSRMTLSERRQYEPDECDAFMADAGNTLSFIGCAIVRRSWWMNRDRAAYYGTLFVHVGVIFQLPKWSRAVVLPEPLVVIRLGNAMWSGRSFEIWTFMWPKLIWGFAGYSDAAKRAVTDREPWRNVTKMLLARAAGGFGKDEYRRFIKQQPKGPSRLVARAIVNVPGSIANMATVVLLGLRGGGRGPGMYNIVASSPHATKLNRRLARLFGQSSSLEPKP